MDDLESIQEIVNNVVDIITNWKAIGALSVAAGLILLTVKVFTKVGFVRQILEAQGLTWVRPLVASVGGGVGAMLLALSAGHLSALPLISAFISGAFAGFAGTGARENARLVTKDAREKQRVHVTSLETVVDELAEERRIQLPQGQPKERLDKLASALKAVSGPVLAAAIAVGALGASPVSAHTSMAATEVAPHAGVLFTEDEAVEALNNAQDLATCREKLVEARNVEAPPPSPTSVTVGGPVDFMLMGAISGIVGAVVGGGAFALGMLAFH